MNNIAAADNANEPIIDIDDFFAHLERNSKHMGQHRSLGSQTVEETNGICDCNCRKPV